MMRLLVHFFVLSCVSVTCVYSKDFGKRGNIYPILEEPFLEMIEGRLKGIDFEQEKKKIQERAKRRVEEPTAVLVKKAEGRVFFYDPSYVLEKDIVLPDGKILHRAGTKVNPLDHIDYEDELVFLNSDDISQREWLEGVLKEKEFTLESLSGRVKVILTKGKPLEFKKELEEGKFTALEGVYFDQDAILINKFGIRAVPARVKVEGKMLRIEEVKIEDSNESY